MGRVSRRVRIVLQSCGLLLAIIPPRASAAAPRSDEAVIALPEVIVETNTTAMTAARIQSFEAARRTVFPSIGASVSSLGRDAITDRPQGSDTPFDRLLTELPGVSQDSAASRPDFHVRNEYGNVQYRIDGILLPDNVSGLGTIFDTSFVGNLTLLDGTLPAQYGLRTAGVLDITPRQFGATGGDVGLYGGSHGIVTPTLDYGGISGASQYFVGLRGFRSNVGIENPTASYEAVHDRTEQGRAFAYLSTILSDTARVVTIAGFSDNQTQIPNVSGLQPLADFGGNAILSTSLNERENNRFAFGLAALQTKGERLDTQLSFFARYAQVHFVPDVAGDLAFDDVASDVSRRSVLEGVSMDSAYRLGAHQVIRAGFDFTAEETHNDNLLTVLPVMADGTVVPTPVSYNDNIAKLGINVGGYLQDEIALTPTLALNLGLRFDQLYQYVAAHQLSPRAALVLHPSPATTLHAGYARYFTPPAQSEAAGSTIGLAAGTSLQPGIPLADPMRPERSHYFDIGADRTLRPGWTIGGDLYLKLATDYIDDGEFGEARVLSQLNYARATSQGAELKTRYVDGGFSAYGNISTNRTKDTRPASNQYLLDADEYAYITQHFIFADDVQLVTASAGASYRFGSSLVAANMVYGSGLRAGFANIDHVPAYAQVNLGFAHELRLGADPRPLTIRLDVVNLFDTIYQLRDGSGIGVDAPQYGPRRGVFLGLSKRI